MAKCYLFYAVDLEWLQSVHGCGDPAVLDRLSESLAPWLQPIDESVAEMFQCERYPSARGVLEQIVMGTCVAAENTFWMFRDVLQGLCDTQGEQVADGVASLPEHSYESRLLELGPPIPIPVDPEDRVLVGHLPQAEIRAEMDRVRTAPRVARRHWRFDPWSLLHGRVHAARESDQVVADDMDHYLEILGETAERRNSLVAVYCS